MPGQARSRLSYSRDVHGPGEVLLGACAVECGCCMEGRQEDEWCLIELISRGRACKPDSPAEFSKSLTPRNLLNQRGPIPNPSRQYCPSCQLWWHSLPVFCTPFGLGFRASRCARLIREFIPFSVKSKCVRMKGAIASWTQEINPEAATARMRNPPRSLPLLSVTVCGRSVMRAVRF